ncbi:MAG: lipopolysaccharide biosynthesis protein [Salinivirgaceae bacterium]|nr:lipopolysaccharide biosynthesis protein [Salinivirgaceae bacterium]
MNVKSAIKKSVSSSIFKNLSVLVVGTIIAQLVVIAFQIVIRRIYSPEDFGAFAVYMSILGMVATIASLRYEQTIILPKEKVKARALLSLSILIAFLFSFIVFLLVILFKTQIVALLGLSEQYGTWLFFIPISVFLFCSYQAINFYLIREKQFTVSASNKVIRRLSEGSVQSLFGTLGSSFGLFVGDMIGQGAMICRAVFVNKKVFKNKISFHNLTEVALRYKDFPLKNGIPSILNSISLLLPVILINRFFSEEITGFFDLARMVLIIPLSLVTASLSQVLLQRFTEKRNNKQSIVKDSLGIVAFLLLFSTSFILIIELFGPKLFEFIFGNEWIESGNYAKILVWAFGLKFIISPFNVSFTAFERIGVGSLWQTFYFALIISLIFIPHDNIVQFLRNYLIIEIVAYVFAAIMNVTIIANYENSLKI